jgi:hypothetical protein
MPRDRRQINRESAYRQDWLPLQHNPACRRHLPNWFILYVFLPALMFFLAMTLVFVLSKLFEWS